jgi:hypothetical protein
VSGLAVCLYTLPAFCDAMTIRYDDPPPFRRVNERLIPSISLGKWETKV